MKCTNCRKTLYLGLDVLEVRHGVIGQRGIIPLEDSLFCSDRCLAEYYGSSTDDARREDTVSFS